MLHATLTTAMASPISPNDRWLAIGDSITHDGDYPRFIECFYLTRFPTSNFHYANAGISGDTASGGLNRFEWDIAPQKPTVATINFGMNDVSRGLYGGNLHDSDLDEKRQQAIDQYAEKLDGLVVKLLDSSCRVIIMSPTPYDDTAVFSGENLPGCNDALAELARRGREVARRRDCQWIDLHGPLTALNRRLQADDAQATLVSQDRVHPGPPGHLVAAAKMLEALEVQPAVSIMHLDFDRPAVRLQKHCTIDAITATKTSISFQFKSDSLPFPVPESAREALNWIPFQQALNREELRVQGLPSANYELAIDQSVLGKFSAEGLAIGINLADLPTPQMQQSKAVYQVLEKRWQAIGKLRLIAMLEHHQGTKLTKPVTHEAMEPVLQEWEKELAADPNHWQQSHPQIYRESKPRQAEIAAEAEQLLAEARALALPKLRHLSLTRLP